jgi:ABC-type Zn2+ transport system substrate-binding protein/surface adhesin
MNQNNGDNNNGNSNPKSNVTWGTKVGYIGTGVLIGLVIYPFVRKALGKIQPKVDKIFDDLTGKAESFAEKASDMMAKARDNVNAGDRHTHDHEHDHDHSHESTDNKETVQ